MIAYNNEWLNNLLVRKQAEQAQEQQCITKEEMGNIYAAYPVGFYTPNIFVRIGLFILTLIIVQFSLGLVSMIFLSALRDNMFGGLFIVYGFIVYAGLEFMVRKNHFKSGVDDALLWMAFGCLVGGLNALGSISWLTNAIVVFMLALFFFLRFTNTVMAGIAGLALLAVVFYTGVQIGNTAKAAMPFVLMIAAAGMYFYVRYWKKEKISAHYDNGLVLLSVISLLCLYVAGNYLVVREASIALFDLRLKEGESIPFGWLFWIFTIVIPVVCIIRGLQRKDVVLLRVGLLLVAAGIFTVRYYYHFLPAETAMVAGGILLISIAYAVIKYLREPKHGFTYKEQQEFLMDNLQVESLIIAQTFSTPSLPADTATQFGGGTGGGGGAGGTF